MNIDKRTQYEELFSHRKGPLLKESEVEEDLSLNSGIISQWIYRGTMQRILRGIMRPFRHTGVELAGIGVLGVIAALAAAVVIAAAVLAVAWARDMAGIAPNSVQDAVLTIAVCSAAAYAFFVETNRLFSKLRRWTDTLHQRING